MHVLSGTRPIKSVHYSLQRHTAQQSTKQEQGWRASGQGPVPPGDTLQCGCRLQAWLLMAVGPLGCLTGEFLHKLLVDGQFQMWITNAKGQSYTSILVLQRPSESINTLWIQQSTLTKLAAGWASPDSSNNHSDHASAVSCIVSRNAWVSSSSRFNAVSLSGLRQAALEKIQTVGPAALAPTSGTWSRPAASLVAHNAPLPAPGVSLTLTLTHHHLQYQHTTTLNHIFVILRLLSHRVSSSAEFILPRQSQLPCKPDTVLQPLQRCPSLP